MAEMGVDWPGIISIGKASFRSRGTGDQRASYPVVCVHSWTRLPFRIAYASRHLTYKPTATIKQGHVPPHRALGTAPRRLASPGGDFLEKAMQNPFELTERVPTKVWWQMWFEWWRSLDDHRPEWTTPVIETMWTRRLWTKPIVLHELTALGLEVRKRKVFRLAKEKRLEYSEIKHLLWDANIVM